MDPKSKSRVRAKDRISELPDAIICLILSSLPTKFAVRTTILSTRWNNIWINVPNLDFDGRRDFPQAVGGPDRFKIFVDTVLFLRNSTDIRKFQLKNYCADDFSVIERWICTAVWRNVVELDVDLSIDNDKPFQFPRSVFRCKTLEVLTVFEYGCYVIYDPPASGCFPKLKSLHVRVDQTYEDSLAKLFAYFPVLEHVTIDGFLDLYAVYSFKVYAPQLKTLRISLEGSYENNFHFNAPKLENFDFENIALSTHISLENVKYLVKARIAFRALSELEDLTSFPNQAVALLAQISNVKHLHLTAHCLEAWYLPSLDNLNRLKLVLYNCNYWTLLKAVLDRSPNLEDLVIKDRTKCDKTYSKAHWDPPKVVPNCLVSHLKAVSISGFRGRRIEMEVAKYLLENGYSLKKMTICASCMTEALYQELLMFPRASVACKVGIIKMRL